MIDISKLREYYKQDRIIVSIHALERLRQRKIKQRDIKQCILNGEIIEQYPEDYPYPSCLVFGHNTESRILHVVVSDEGTTGRIITTYFPDEDNFEADMKTRKENRK